MGKICRPPGNNCRALGKSCRAKPAAGNFLAAAFRGRRAQSRVKFFLNSGGTAIALVLAGQERP